MNKLFIVIILIIGVYSDSLVSIDWESCDDVTYKRRIPSPSDPMRRHFGDNEYEINILEIKANSVDFKRGSDAVFHIITRLLKGTLRNPILNVQVFNGGNGMRFVEFPLYSICSQAKMMCPIEADEDSVIEFVITEQIPWVPDSVLEIPFEAVVHLEDSGEVLKCVKFPIKLKQ